MKIFVFGSNLAGFHGAGSARHALEKCGAKMGVGVGLCGSSYAIPTKDANLLTLPLNEIKTYVNDFIEFAILHPEYQFDIVEIGCGLAGYTHADIAPMFEYVPINCNLPKAFVEILRAEVLTAYENPTKSKEIG